MNTATVIANGREVTTALPCSIEEFLVAQHLLPRSVVVELNGEAVVKTPDRATNPPEVIAPEMMA